MTITFNLYNGLCYMQVDYYTPSYPHLFHFS